MRRSNGLPTTIQTVIPGPMQYWLLKTEPSTFSFSELLRLGKTNWNGVRNYQARSFMREVKKGDLCLIYHSGEDRAVVGVAEVTSLPYPDLDPKKPGDWVQFDLKPKTSFANAVSLSTLKSTPSLKNLLLIKQSRLSVMPISSMDFKTISKLGEK